METRQGLPVRWLPPRVLHSHARCGWLLLFVFALLAAGCASPGEPVERKPPVPEEVSDLGAEQADNSVVLTFTLPTETADHRSLEQSPAVEIFRDFEPAAAATAASSVSAPAPAHLTLHTTIPAAVVDNFVAGGRFRYPDPLQPEDFTQHPDSVVVYVVRTSISAKKESADSNAFALHIYPAPDPIDDLRGQVTHSGIELAWTAPKKTPVGPAPPIASYGIYRAESQTAPSAAGSASASGENAEAVPRAETAKAPAPAMKIGEVQSTNYLDTQFELGKTYIYTVRSVVKYDRGEIESADSNPATVLARDVTAPAAPQGLLTVYVPAQGNVPAHIELSWAISPETDLAGYNIYRSEQAGVPGTRINSELLLTPAFTDMNAVPGRTYFYSVTAVDRSGNESPPSTAVSGTVPAESATP